MTKTITNKIQTFSLAFVMGAMLGVGIGFMPQQAQAQEPTAAQRVVMLEQINMLMELIAQLMAELEVRQERELSAGDSSHSEEKNATIDKFTFSEPSITKPNSLQWSTEGTESCALYHAGPRRYSLLEANVGTVGQKDVALSFPSGYDYVKFELRCQSDSQTVSAYAKITQGDLSGVAAELSQELQKSFADAFSVDYEEKAEDAIEGLTEDLEANNQWYESTKDKVAAVGKTADVLVLLGQVELVLTAAEEAYDDTDYEEALSLVETGEEFLDTLNDLLDDVEDGRL